MTLSIEFSRAGYLGAASHFAAGNVRYFRQGQGIRLEPAERGVIIVATDGFALLAIHDEAAVIHGAETFEPFTFAMADGKWNAVRKVSARDKQCCINVTDGFLSIVGDATRYGTALVDGRYPEWRRIWPQHDETQGVYGVGYASHQLARLDKAATLLSRSKATAVRLMSSDPTRPTIALFAGEPNAAAVVMPCRMEHGKMPAFLPQSIHQRAA